MVYFAQNYQKFSAVLFTLVSILVQVSYKVSINFSSSGKQSVTLMISNAFVSRVYNKYTFQSVELQENPFVYGCFEIIKSSS